jgi:hypothetical protein
MLLSREAPERALVPSKLAYLRADVFWLTCYSLAYVQMNLATAALLRRFEFELDDDVVRERDVDVVRDCVVGLATPESKGIRFKVVRKRG